jgi:hypothetical protein
MSLDLNTDWTDAELATLIASVTDDRDWRLEVGTDGIARLNDISAHPNSAAYDETLHCYLEVWSAGTDFVGPGAAGDKSLMAKIAKGLRDNYPTRQKGAFIFIDT